MGGGFDIEDGPTTTEAGFAIGDQVVGGRFRLGERLSWGGMGTVYRALDLETGREVAVKLPHIGAPGATDSRFEREVRAVASVVCSSVIGYVGHGSEEEPFLAMELVDGEPLVALLQQGALDEARSLSLARRVASALATIHLGGWVHRDVKPGNIVVSARGEIKLLDFGLSRSLDVTTGSTTAQGDLVGTLGYMAPEQLKGQPVVDARTDVFSLGVVLFECLTGRRAYQRTVSSIARGIREPPLDVRGAGIRGATAALLESMLSHEPGDRPSDGIEALVRLLWLAAPERAPRSLGPVRRALRYALRSGSVSLVGSFAGTATEAASAVAILLAEIQAPADVVFLSCDPSHTATPGSHARALAKALEGRGFDGISRRLLGSRLGAASDVEGARRLIVVLEDAPWCDPSSATVLEELAAARALSLVVGHFSRGRAESTLLPGWPSVVVDAPAEDVPFDRLSPLARWVLRASAMFGRAFPLDGVRALVAGREAEDVEHVLEHLVHRGSLLRASETPPRYAFASGFGLDLARGLASPGEARLGASLVEAYRRSEEPDAAPLAAWLTSSEERFATGASPRAASR